MFGWKREEHLAACNKYTIDSVIAYIRTLTTPGPTSVPNNIGGTEFTTAFFDNWAVKNVLDELSKVKDSPLIAVRPNRVTQEAIDTLVEQLGIHAQHVSTETDATSYAYEYSRGIERIAQLVRDKFIQRVSAPTWSDPKETNPVVTLSRETIEKLAVVGLGHRCRDADIAVCYSYGSGIGTNIVAKCTQCGQRYDVTDYGSW